MEFMILKIILSLLALFLFVILSAQIKQTLAPKAPPEIKNPVLSPYNKSLRAIPPPPEIPPFPYPPLPPKKPSQRLIKS